MKPSALGIIFLTCVLLAITEAGVPHLQPKCRCTETVPQEISDNRIVKVEIFQPGPHCKDIEVIATIKFRKEFTVCLNPKVKWVQNALKKRNLTL